MGPTVIANIFNESEIFSSVKVATSAEHKQELVRQGYLFGSSFVKEGKLRHAMFLPTRDLLSITSEFFGESIVSLVPESVNNNSKSPYYWIVSTKDGIGRYSIGCTSNDLSFKS